jgi:hypothetical protein
MENVGERRSLYRVRGRNLRERDHLEDPGLCGKISIKLTFQEVALGHGLN